jgi:DNA-damage-inducible protein D
MPDEASTDLFHFEEERPSFESLGRENGFRYWLASELARCLGYSNLGPVNKAVQRAMAACAQLGAPILENFVEAQTAGERDWRLSRFACYLTVMNADPRNPKVARAQGWFAALAEAFRQFTIETDGVERVVIRGEVAEREKSLSSTAFGHGVENYAFFQNAGYRGLYNMNLCDLKARKRIPDGRSVLDFMGKTELAANLFRITQTEEKIKNEDIRGQKPLERAAEDAGKRVRQTMREISGAVPEHLPTADDIKKVQSGLKRVGREFAKLDKPRAAAK